MDDADATPRIAIVGGGPIGLEAALYGRYLGYQVSVLERNQVAEHVRKWAHVRMFSPFGMNRSLLGLAALQAQQNVDLPPDDAILTGREYLERYLAPLAASDLLVDCVHEGVEVVAVGRDGPLKHEGDRESRGDGPFRLLVDQDGVEDVIEADYVLDTSGVLGNPCWSGHGGIPARGERAAASRVCYHVPDVLGAERDRFAGRRTILVGGGYSAATAAVALGTLCEEVPGTEVLWVLRRDWSEQGPLPRRQSDRLPERDCLAEQANRCALEPPQGMECIGRTVVTQLDEQAAWQVTLASEAGERVEVCDEFLALVGYRPEFRWAREMQLRLDERSEATPELTAALTELGGGDCLDLATPELVQLAHPEPNFFVLGSKSCGRDANFLLAYGIQQVQVVYTAIAERADLNLYQTMQHLLD